MKDTAKQATKAARKKAADRPTKKPAKEPSKEPSKEPATEPARTRRPRGSLNLKDILDAAQQIVETDGRDALTMRAVATALGAGVMSLYSHVRSKEDILDHLAARVLGEVAAPHQQADETDWRPALRRYFIDLRATLVAHPEFQRLFAVQGAASKAAFNHAEAAFAILAGAGITGARAARIWFAAMTYAVGFVMWELPRLVEAASAGQAPAQARRDRMAGLPVEEYSHIVALSSVLSTSTSREQFEFGLDALLEGATIAELADDGAHRGD
ncbi:MAG TPA: TetR/AcrR family transcriptional regulator [Nocardioides sp.]|nr:TetR/AcrR family transcriptional regulator [Nocardioides sp.]